MATRWKLWSIVLIAAAGTASLAILGFSKMNDKGTDDALSYPDLLARSKEELRIKIAAHDGLWHLRESGWSVDQNKGTIIFTRPDGVVATCPVQIIGTLNTADSTWLWAWDHPSIQPPLREHAERVRAYGEAHGIERLTTRKLASSEEECWEFAALACKLVGAQGACGTPAGQALVFLTFGEPQLVQKSGAGSQPGDESEQAASPAETLPFAADMPDDVRQTVTDFIAARYDWETAAYAAMKACKKGERETASDQACAAYEALIQKWCGDDVTVSDISYGSDPSHNPEREVIRDAAQSSETWVVRTRSTDSTGYASDYEYHLRRDGERWLIKSLLRVIDGEKFESF